MIIKKLLVFVTPLKISLFFEKREIETRAVRRRHAAVELLNHTQSFYRQTTYLTHNYDLLG